MATFFGSNSTSNITETNLGSRLYHIKEAAIGSESIVSILPDDNIVVNTCSSFGKSLLNVSTLNQLVGLINSGDSKVEVIDSATGEINFTLDNQLKLVVKNLYTEVLNELRSLNIIPATDLEYNLGTSTKRYGTGFIRKITTNSTGQISIGDGTGTTGTSSVNIGNNAGNTGTPDYSVSIGRGANQGGASASVCLGFAAGQNNNGGTGTICIGHQSGAGQGVNGVKAGGISIGGASAYNGLGANAVAIGASACYTSTTNDNAVSIGYEAGKNNQGANAIAIGNKAGLTTSHEKSIILNATGVDLSSSGTDRLHIAPIRSGGTGNNLVYDTGTKEVQVGGVASMAGITTSGHITPDSSGQRDLGANGTRFRTLYTEDFSVSGKIYSSSSSTPIILAQDTTERARLTSTFQLGSSANPNTGIILYNNSSVSDARAISNSVLSNEICGLAASGSDQGQLRLSAGGNTTVTAKTYIDLFGNANNVMIFGTKGAEKMRIAGNDFVGIGNAAPTERLDVGGNLKVSGSISCTGLIQPSTTNPLSFNTNNSDRMFINSSGTLVLARSITGGSGLANGGVLLFNGSGNNESRGASSALLSNEIRGLSGSGSDAGVLRIGAGGGSSTNNHSYIDFEGFGTRCIRFNTGGAFRAIIDASGYLGVGTATPAYNLHINPSGTSAFAGNDKKGLLITDSTVPRILLENLGNTSGQRLSAIQNLSGIWSVGVLNDTGGSWNKERILGLNLSNYDATFAGDILTDSVGDKDIGSSANPFGKLFVNNIGSSGTPVQTLYADVWATSSTSGLRCANNLVLATDLSLPTITWYDTNVKSMILVDTVNTTNGGKLSYDSANSEIVISTTSSNVERVRIGANGLKSKRAIHNTDATSGITSTDSQLQLSGATKSQILFENTGNTSKKVIALYNSADKLCINSMDNTGTTYTASGDIIQFDMANGWVIVNALLRPTLDLGSDFGGTNKRWANGYFDKVYTTSGTVNTSDRNQKKDIQPLGDSLKQLLKLEPVSFKYKEGTSGRTHLGFIAQQVAEVIPDCAIFVQNGDSCGLRYEQFSALIVKAVQELHSKVEKIEARKLVGGAVIDTSGLTEDFVRVYERLEALESEVNKPVKPQLHRCVEISRINELFQRISNIETQIHCNESKSNSSEDFELIHSLMEKNHQQELRINELENKLNNLPRGEAKNEIEDSDTGGLSMIESLQDRLFKAEQLAIKQDKMIKKLTTAVNKLLKQSE